MRYTPLGRTGLQVSAVCLGGNAWGAVGRRRWGALDAKASAACFRRALDHGINFVDTADAYNDGDSESIMGAELIPLVPRADLVICTKVGLRIGSAKVDAPLSRAHIMASVDASLRRLRTDYVDLYLFHVPDPATPIAESLAAMTEVVRAGKARAIGASNYSARAFAQMLSTAEAGELASPMVMQCLYNLVQREAELDLISLCREHGVAVTPFSPNARGFLAGHTRGTNGPSERARHDALADPQRWRPSDHAVLDAAVEIAHAHACSPSEIALAWLQQKGVASAVVGISRIEHIDAAAAASDITLAPEEIALLEGPYAFRPPAA